MTYSPDGRTIMVCSTANHAYFLSLAKEGEETKEQWKVMDKEPTTASNGIFNHAGDGLVVAHVSEASVRILDYPSMSQRETFPAHVSGCTALALDPRGRYLATAGNDSIVNLFDVNDWISAKTITSCDHAITAVSFSYDGEYIAIASAGSYVDIVFLISDEHFLDASDNHVKLEQYFVDLHFLHNIYDLVHLIQLFDFLDHILKFLRLLFKPDNELFLFLVVIVVFIIVFVSDSVLNTPTTGRNVPSQTVGSGSSGNKSFFDKTGAVAGTFAAVGIVVLAIIALVIMMIIRRRRARKWDDEVSAAAAEAANSRMPVFLDEPDGDHSNNNYGGNSAAPSSYPGGGAAAYGQNGYNNVGNYSDVSSHGTYGQPAMSHEGHYPEMSGPGPGGIFDHNAAYAGGAAAAGAAGIGVARARSRGADTMASAGTRNTGPSARGDFGAGMDPNNGYAAGLGEGGSPYPAFLAPGHGYDVYNSAASQTHSSDTGYPTSGASAGPDSRTTHANAMASVAAAAAAGSPSPPPATSAPQAHSGESYASHYEAGYSGSGSPNRPDAASRSLDNSGRPSDENAPRAGQKDGLPNPFSSGIESEDESDGEEDVPGRRVLKVSNLIAS
ncbi:hypothetical protein V5O48_001291 [Marasmius crinis-equi]|uniref:Uncharacterized protein n=1 Tax=Marasmius crinis-equi TaxID=585013 RepID=A0ABR3FYX2_9AGAR